MRILFISGLTGSGAGGAQTETIRLVRGISAAGAKVAIAIDVPHGFSEIQYFQLDYPPSNCAASQILAAITLFKPNVIHVVGGGIRLLRQVDTLASPVPWVFTAHNVPPSERTFPGLFGRNNLHYLARDALALPSTLLWKHFLMNANFRSVISHSETVSIRLRAYGCPRTKIHQIPFGFNVSEILMTDTSPFPVDAFPKLLTIAGQIHHKGLHDVVMVMNSLRTRFRNTCYRIIGERRDAYYATYLENKILKENLGDCIRLVGNVSEARKVAALHDADLYVQPSHEEGFCIAFAEAAAVVPRIVGTATGEMQGLSKDDDAAIIVAPKNPPALLDAMVALLNANVDQKTIKRRHDRLLQRYPWQDYFAKHLAAYSDSTDSSQP
jgi:glycosyltransferase involved in cell wall biosynthesis